MTLSTTDKKLSIGSFKGKIIRKQISPIRRIDKDDNRDSISILLNSKVGINRELGIFTDTKKRPVFEAYEKDDETYIKFIGNSDIPVDSSDIPIISPYHPKKRKTLSKSKVSSKSKTSSTKDKIDGDSFVSSPRVKKRIKSSDRISVYNDRLFRYNSLLDKFDNEHEVLVLNMDILSPDNKNFAKDSGLYEPISSLIKNPYHNLGKHAGYFTKDGYIVFMKNNFNFTGNKIIGNFRFRIGNCKKQQNDKPDKIYKCITYIRPTGESLKSDGKTYLIHEFKPSTDINISKIDNHVELLFSSMGLFRFDNTNGISNNPDKKNKEMIYFKLRELFLDDSSVPNEILLDNDFIYPAVVDENGIDWKKIYTDDLDCQSYKMNRISEYFELDNQSKQDIDFNIETNSGFILNLTKIYDKDLIYIENNLDEIKNHFDIENYTKSNNLDIPTNIDEFSSFIIEQFPTHKLKIDWLKGIPNRYVDKKIDFDNCTIVRNIDILNSELYEIKKNETVNLSNSRNLWSMGSNKKVSDAESKIIDLQKEILLHKSNINNIKSSSINNKKIEITKINSLITYAENSIRRLIKKIYTIEVIEINRLFNSISNLSLDVRKTVSLLKYEIEKANNINNPKQAIKFITSKRTRLLNDNKKIIDAVSNYVVIFKTGKNKILQFSEYPKKYTNDKNIMGILKFTSSINNSGISKIYVNLDIDSSNVRSGYTINEYKNSVRNRNEWNPSSKPTNKLPFRIVDTSNSSVISKSIDIPKLTEDDIELSNAKNKLIESVIKEEKYIDSIISEIGSLKLKEYRPRILNTIENKKQHFEIDLLFTNRIINQLYDIRNDKLFKIRKMISNIKNVNQYDSMIEILITVHDSINEEIDIILNKFDLLENEIVNITDSIYEQGYTNKDLENEIIRKDVEIELKTIGILEHNTKNIIELERKINNMLLRNPFIKIIDYMINPILTKEEKIHTAKLSKIQYIVDEIKYLENDIIKEYTKIEKIKENIPEEHVEILNSTQKLQSTIEILEGDIESLKIDDIQKIKEMFSVSNIGINFTKENTKEFLYTLQYNIYIIKKDIIKKLSIIPYFENDITIDNYNEMMKNWANQFNDKIKPHREKITELTNEIISWKKSIEKITELANKIISWKESIDDS